jgi:hypothetical protein
VHARRSCLFPVKVLGRLFRGKVDAALSSARDEGRLDLPDDLQSPRAFARLRRRLFAKDWVVYAKRPFAGAEQVYSYLGLYTHRVGISNHRILSVTDDSVTIATRAGAKATVAPQELIRRFLNHVLPKGFRKIRHYGLLASSNAKTRLEAARRLLQPSTTPAQAASEPDRLPNDWKSLYEALTGSNLRTCPACRHGRLRTVPLHRARPSPGEPRPPP